MGAPTNRPLMSLHLPDKFLSGMFGWMSVKNTQHMAQHGSGKECTLNNSCVSHGRAYMDNLWAKKECLEIHSKYPRTPNWCWITPFHSTHLHVPQKKHECWRLSKKKASVSKKFHLTHALLYLPHKVCGPSILTFISSDIFIRVVSG